MMTIILAVGGAIIAAFVGLRLAIKRTSFRQKPLAQPTPEERRIQVHFENEQALLRNSRDEIDEQTKGATLDDIARDLNRRHDK
jgi:hypothetical protein